MRAIIVRKKFWGLQMLTWVWLARAKHELTKPKSTFRPQNFLSGLRAPHEQSFPFPTGAVVYAHFLGGGSGQYRMRYWFSHFFKFTYLTRGTVEPAFVGIHDFLNPHPWI